MSFRKPRPLELPPIPTARSHRALKIFFALAVCALVALAILTCRGPAHQVPSRVAAVESAAVSTPDAAAARTYPTEVSLSEFAIDAPSVARPGPTRFIVSNLGDVGHGFVITGERGSGGDGLHRELTHTLNPGKTASFTVELRPGTYRLFCPLDDHAGKGMSAELTVEPGLTMPVTGPAS